MLKTKPLAIFQISPDPENRVPFVYEFKYFPLYWISAEKNTASTLSPIEKIISNLAFGKKFSAVNKMRIKQAVAEIDRVEKTRTVFETSGDDVDIHPKLCILAAVMVIGAIFLEGYRL